MGGKPNPAQLPSGIHGAQPETLASKRALIDKAVFAALLRH
jgi:hypothetical protein